MVGLARAAEAAGLERTWLAETPGHDSLLAAMQLGLATERIGVASGIAYAFTRPPLAMAGALGELGAALGDRFELGLGTGTRGVRRRYGVEGWEHPARDLAAYVAAVRAATPGAAPAMHAAATNPIMARWAASCCDGVLLLSICTEPGYLAEVMLPAIDAGAAAAGRPRPRLGAWLLVAAGDTEEEARDALRLRLAFYFSTPSYRAPAERIGGAAAAAEIRRLAAEGEYTRWDAAAAAVPAEWAAIFGVHGTQATLAGRLVARERELRAAGVDEVVFQPDGPASAAKLLGALSPPART